MITGAAFVVSLKCKQLKMSKDTTIPAKGKGKVKTHEVHFSLKEPNSGKGTLIRAVFRYESGKLVYSTQCKILPSYWNKKKEKPHNLYKAEHEDLYKLVNKALEEIETAIESIHAQNPNLSLVDFRGALDIELGRELKATAVTTTLIGYINDYIERKSGTNELRPNTIKRYKTIRNKLIAFAEFRNIELDFDSIDYSFRDHFIKWLYTETSTKSQNTVNRDLSMIQNILGKAFEEGKHTNLIYTKKKFNVKTVKTSKYAMNEAEVQTLYDFDDYSNEIITSKNVTPAFAEKVKDWYLVACYSSLRWSDFSDISSGNIVQIDGTSFIHKQTTVKTDEEVYIPVNENLLQILEKYDYKSPQMSSQRFNDAIKLVCESAGMTEKIMLKVSDKGDKKTIPVRKCDAISAHTGRRTWATINYQKGYPILLLMQVTGHQKESTFLTYIGVSKKEMAKRLSGLMKELKEKELRAKMKVS